jgi:predicted glycosyltransferase
MLTNRLQPMKANSGGLFVYCQSTFGVGHFVRTVRLLRALRAACPSTPINLFHGGRSVVFLELSSDVEAHELEPLVFTSLNGTLYSPDGSGTDQVLLRRMEYLVESLLQLRPRAVLFEHFPFGRWGFADEILPLIECCRSLSPRPQLWSSVRDIPILSDYDFQRMCAVVPLFDRIFVHSDPNVLPFDVGRPMPESLRARIEYTGYVTPAAEKNIQRNAQVLVHAGGGHDSQAFWAAVNALRHVTIDLEFKMCGEDTAVLTGLASTSRLLQSARRCICMAGYNAVAEWLAIRTPTIFVPRRSEPEQLNRLLWLRESTGGPMVISDPTPQALRSAWDALSEDEPFRAQVWINGQATFAESVAPSLQ